MRIPPRLLYLVLLFATAAANAAPQTLALDAAATKIGFTLGATLHTVEGTVRLESGAIEFDADTGAARGEIAIDATSATTGLASRDRVMHGDVLESPRFAKIVFRPQRITVKRRDATSADVELGGILVMHGAEHPLVVPAGLVERAGRIAIDAAFRLPYVEWGMRDPSNLVLRVDRFVDVAVHAEGTLAPPRDLPIHRE